MKLLRFGLVSLLSLASSSAFAAYKLEVGSSLPRLTISDTHGGIVKDGGSWDSQSMKDALTFIVYVDPDDSELNDALVERLREEKFPEEHFRSVAIINMAATWKPNVIIMKVLKGKQETFPRTTYVFDKDRFASKNWGLTPEGYHVLLVDRDGSVLFEKAGKVEKNEIETFINLIRSKIKEAEGSATKTSEPAATDATKAK